VIGVSGMSLTGEDAVRQFAIEESQAADGTPAPAFSAAALTGNPTIGFCGNATNDISGGLTNPTSWPELRGSNYGTPSSGAQSVARNSGFTGTTITWGSTSASIFGDCILELDTTAATTPVIPDLVMARRY
jgi:hypothetical protein